MLTAADSLREGTFMETLANVNGAIVPLKEVRISVQDRGFLFGDAVYEVIRVYHGKPWLLEEHLRRLAHSLEAVRIRGIDLEDNLIMVEGAVPGPRDGFVLISKAKAPPRERRGFAGAATKDALKASKKAAPKKK